MRAIVLVEWGPRRLQKAVIAPGERLRIGRHERATLCMPHDEEMSGLHCELFWDGARCTLRDLGSMHGTFLNGERVEAGQVGHGAWFQAGETVFSLYHEGLLPPWSPAGGKTHVSPERNAEVLSGLRAEGAPLYAVLDAARDDRILTLLRASAEPLQSLYEGLEGEELAEVAPYLVALPTDGWLLERLVEEGWGKGWGIYLTCRRPFKEVRRQLRRQLLVSVRETGAVLYYRFYDPLGFAATLPVCNARQRQELFGDIEAFWIEGPMDRLIHVGPDGVATIKRRAR